MKSYYAHAWIGSILYTFLFFFVIHGIFQVFRRMLKHRTQKSKLTPSPYIAIHGRNVMKVYCDWGMYNTACSINTFWLGAMEHITFMCGRMQCLRCGQKLSERKGIVTCVIQKIQYSLIVIPENCIIKDCNTESVNSYWL